MRVLLAGATGAIGRPLTAALAEAGHTVVALTRDHEAATALSERGIEALVADALDRGRLLGEARARGLQVDAVVHQLTALRTPPARHSGMHTTNQLRTVGTRNLIALAKQTGARRLLTQSIVFGYGYTDHGSMPLTEGSEFGKRPNGPTAPHIEAMAANESLVRADEQVEGIALRYGLFYGADSDTMRTMLRARKVPIPSRDGGRLAWVHIDDAVSATVAALERGRPGAAYNIVDDRPTTWREMMTAAAGFYGAPQPRALPAWLIRLAAPYVASMVLDTSMQVSNLLARDELGWAPTFRTFHEWSGGHAPL